MADFLNAARPEEIVFGPNMTTLTFRLSRALAAHPRRRHHRRHPPRPRRQHLALAAPGRRDRGCRVRWVDFDPDDGTLDLDDFKAALAEKPTWWPSATPPTPWARSTRPPN